jgi:hypothetical protein
MGMSPVKIMMSADVEASATISFDASSKARVASVLKLKGRKISVSGSSFKMSIKTKITALRTEVLAIGRFILKSVFKDEIPSVREA